MAKSFLRLDTRRALADGSYPIQIAVGYGSNLYLSTGISAKIEDWDTDTRLYVGAGAKRINNTLSTLLVQVSNRILDLREKGLLDKLTRT
uniref:Arm DNA-binding domain-containing protein n=1 Tax=Prevotella heparinolytica TaxID=28113 RepID=UPI00359FA799